MAKTMTATAVKTRILSLLDEVAAGEEIEITKHGRTVARLIPARGPHGLRDRFAGLVATTDPGDELFTTAAEWDLP